MKKSSLRFSVLFRGLLFKLQSGLQYQTSLVGECFGFQMAGTFLDAILHSLVLVLFSNGWFQFIAQLQSRPFQYQSLKPQALNSNVWYQSLDCIMDMTYYLRTLYFKSKQVPGSRQSTRSRSQTSMTGSMVPMATKLPIGQTKNYIY